MKSKSNTRAEPFIPKYCPAKDCFMHTQPTEGFYVKLGDIHWGGSLQPIQRFRCRNCRRSFSSASFRLDFREKKRGLNSKIFHLLMMGVSQRGIARTLRCSEHLIRERKRKLFEFALIKQTQFLKNHLIQEDIVYDGLENFAASQYDPNHINQAIGAESLFMYDFGFCPLNRKGRMSPRQRGINEDLVKTSGRYPKRAIRHNTRLVIERLLKHIRSEQVLNLWTDEHFQYRRAIQYDLAPVLKRERKRIAHFRISSLETRNYQNRLFPVNHADLLCRHHLAAFKRETISFSKTHLAMVQTFGLFMVWKNFMRPLFVKPHKRYPEKNGQTPAMILGFTGRPLKFYEFFNGNTCHPRDCLHHEWRSFVEGQVLYPRSKTSTVDLG